MQRPVRFPGHGKMLNNVMQPSDVINALVVAQSSGHCQVPTHPAHQYEPPRRSDSVHLFRVGWLVVGRPEPDVSSCDVTTFTV
jgi:hypothetical protein